MILSVAWSFGQNKENIQVWYSSELKPESSDWYTDPALEQQIKYRLSRQQDAVWSHGAVSEGISFRIDDSIRYQSILGIGMSLEGTSLYALRKNRSEEEIREMIRMFIDPHEGLGFNLFRICIGTSDFSDGRKYSDHPQGYYTYQDIEGRPFSIQNDIDAGIVGTIKMFIEEAQKMHPPQEILFFASEWSPPAWMKTSGELIGGTLKPGYEPALASYFRKFVEAYEAEGIPIYAITIQNEPNFLPKTYPGMKLVPEQEKEIVKAIHDEFRNPRHDGRILDTRIWINDHNMNHWKNARKVLSDLKMENSLEMVDAAAFHHYNPMASPDNMSKLKNLYPEIDIHMTEHSEWGVSGMHNIQQYFLNWSRSYMYWVPMTTIDLDEHNQGPYNKIPDLSPTLVIERGEGKPDWHATPEFYLIGQFSKFIRPGAKRIECDPGSDKSLTAVAFRNTDGSYAQFLVNQTDRQQAFSTVFGKASFNGLVPAKSVGTFVWKAQEGQ